MLVVDRVLGFPLPISLVVPGTGSVLNAGRLTSEKQKRAFFEDIGVTERRNKYPEEKTKQKGK